MRRELNKKAAFFTQGCKINILDSEVIKEELLNREFEITDNFEEAGVIVINSCTVTGKADSKFKSIINKIKAKNPEALIAAVGCYTQLNSDKTAEFGGVDIILGSGNKYEVVDYIEEHLGKKLENSLIVESEGEEEFSDYHIEHLDSYTRAFFKVQDGCDNFCTYCTIPKARGKNRAKPIESIVRDTKALVKNGYKEIIISGIDLGGYRYEEDGNVYTLYHVIKKMLEIDGFRLRMGSIEPWCLDDKLLDLLVNEERVCSHFHIPLQAGSDSVLKRMNRKYTLSEFDRVIKKLSEKKNAMIATDIIVGFPGETDEDFKISCDYLKESDIAYAHVFSYSDRPLASARKLYPKVETKVIKERSRILREISEEKKLEFYKGNIGAELELIVETCGEDVYSGMSENYVPVTFKSEKKFTKGDVVDIVITECDSDKVTGKLK